MQTTNIKGALLLLLGFVFWFTSCSEDTLSERLGNEAKILISFKVKGRSGTTFNSIINDNEVKIKVSPYLNAIQELDSVCPVFYLSKGATVSPDPSVPQNFAKEGGVIYTVVSEDKKNKKEYNVSWEISDKMSYGKGFSFAEIGAKKSFVELGYPGKVGDYGQGDALLHGDLQMYHAYCGDHIILLSRSYITKGNTQLGIRAIDKLTLEDAGTLNIGKIVAADIKMISSDYKGRCVAAVVSANQTELFYWSSKSDQPRSLGIINISLAPSSSDLSNNMQIAGDVTGDAWITALAPRDAKGSHYRIKISGGKLDSDHTIIETGYSSKDCNQFQMISAFDDSDNPKFVVGDGQGAAGATNTNRCYINNYAGNTVNVMPPLWQNTLQTWWSGTGFTVSRSGGRSPFVSALPINGKTYVFVTSGTAWWHAGAVLSDDLSTLAHENLNIAFGISRGWSYGAWADWYWEGEKEEAYLSVWFGRLGLYTYKMTCFE